MKEIIEVSNLLTKSKINGDILLANVYKRRLDYLIGIKLRSDK
jgi:hypothetical protein